MVSFLFFRYNINNEKRLLDLLKQLSSSMSQEISDYGHLYARNLSSSTFSPSAYYSEQMAGLSQVGLVDLGPDCNLGPDCTSVCRLSS